MGSTRLSSRHSVAVEGLGTQTYTVSIAGAYEVEVKSFLTPPTGLVLTINLNGSAVATSQTVNVNSQLLALSTAFHASVADVITVVMSSAVANDSIPNMVKSIVDLGII